MDRISKNRLKLSIVIVHYNTQELTLQCLRSIREFNPRASYEVLVVDNGSQDNIGGVIAGKFPEVRFIETGQNNGFSKSNNLGIFNSIGDYILLLNSDTCLIEDTINKMIDYMDKNEHVGIAGPREVDKDRRYRISCGSFPTFFSELVRKIWHYRFSLNDYNLRSALDVKHSMVRDINWISGSCMMLRRTALHETGLLDENFFMYFEDVDICNRFWAKGWEVHYFPETSIIHYGGSTARLNIMFVMIKYRQSEIYFTRKYYGLYGEIAIRLLIFMKYISYFIARFPRFIFRKVLRKDVTGDYNSILLSKKVIELVFHAIDKPSNEIFLIPRVKE